jgi:glucans biosynthesis protein
VDQNSLSFVPEHGLCRQRLAWLVFVLGMACQIVPGAPGAPGTCNASESLDALDAGVTHTVTSFAELCACAERLAGEPCRPQPPVPAALRQLTYDQFRLIGFIDGKELWRDSALPFRVGFYHRGHVHNDHVVIHLFEQNRSRQVPFSKSDFHYLREAASWHVPGDLGFAGFRVQGRFPGESRFREIFSFVGASYFRACGPQTELGTSARGLAIDCGLDTPEEFPVFRQYWLTTPRPDSGSMHVLALLDSHSVAGAYEFTLQPGIASSDIEIHAVLYFRQTPRKIGIAPLSSMWQWGDSVAAPQGDHRPEVHDADGLQIQDAAGRWQWRTLSQQNYPSLVQLKSQGLRGFGLLQRDTNPNHYLDDEARYHARPGVWIQPQSHWGSGAIELLELPAPHEGIDNIAAWWVPDSPVVPGRPFELSYRVSFFSGDRPDHDLGKGIAHRVARQPDGTLLVEVDFDGPKLAAHPQGHTLTIQAQAVRAEVLSTECQQTTPGCWTVRTGLNPTGEGPVELSVRLQDEEKELTETWACLCPLNPPAVFLPPWKIKAAGKQEAVQ